ncbi:MAG: hypothetical protein IH960_01290 [Chloroflexi bacterium]|nr:hypothetical protein [Chloroflexota bacterium]
MVNGTVRTLRIALKISAVFFTSFIKAEPRPVFVIFGIGQPMFRSMMSAPWSCRYWTPGTSV